MSKPDTNKLSNEKIQQLLAAVGAKSQEDTSQDANVLEYDWREPRYFNFEQLAKIESFVKTFVTDCADEFTRLYQSDCSVSLVSTTQRFSYALGEEEGQGNCYIPFGTDSKNPFGLVSIPNASALVWTAKVLGGGDASEDPDRKLSKLEETFLLDIASGLLAVFSRAYGKDLHSDRIVYDRSLVDLQGSEELFEITIEVRKADSEEGGTQASFLMCSDKLELVAGKSLSGDVKLSESQIADAILKHVHHVPLSVYVELGQTMLPFKDVMDLQVNDVVVLSKKITEPVDVLIEGRVLFQGRPAQSGGKHAVVIV